MVQKNVAGQKFALKATYAASKPAPQGGAPVTGDAANITPYVSKNFGTVNAISSPSVTEMHITKAPGWYSFDLNQNDTAGNQLLFTAVSTTADVVFEERVVETSPRDYSSNWITNGGDSVIVGSNQDKTGYTLSSAAIAAIWNEVLEGARTARQFMRLILSVLVGKVSGMDSNHPLFRDPADTKTRVDALTDANGNRTSVTLDDS